MNYNIVRTGTGNFETWLNDEGSERLLGMATIDLPEFVNKTITVTGAGVLGDVEMISPGMFESMEAVIHWRSIHGDVARLTAPVIHHLTFRSSQPNYDSATGQMVVQAVKMDIFALVKSTPLGKLEQAETTDTETTLEIINFKLTVDGKELIELSKYDYVYKVNGIDYMSATRAALGL